MKTLYNKKDIFSSVRMGLATLPHIFEYNKEDVSQEPIELSDTDIISCVIYNRKKFIKHTPSPKSIKKFAFAITINQNIFDEFKDEMWEVFDDYQKNNKPKYLQSGYGSKRKILSKDEFTNSILSEYSSLRKNTLEEMFLTELKIEKLQFVIDKYNLPYTEYKNKRTQERLEYIAKLADNK